MVSQNFIDSEQTAERRPAELYHLWQTGLTDEYFTSGDVAVVYDGNTYEPATIQRSNFRHTMTIEAAQVTITFVNVSDRLEEFRDQAVVATVWIEIMKIHRDINPIEVNKKFVGRIKTVSFDGKACKASCISLKGLFKKLCPKYRYQPTCNHHLYSTECGLDRTNFNYSGVVSVLSTDGLYFESDEIKAAMDLAGVSTQNWTRFGYASYGGYDRVIARQNGNEFYLRYKIPGMLAGNTVNVYAGCDGLRQTCYDKFNNISQFLGFADVPWDNPVTTVLK